MKVGSRVGLGASVFTALNRFYSFETFESAASHMLASHVQTARRTPPLPREGHRFVQPNRKSTGTSPTNGV
jgi:hypothetical protein